MQTQTLHSAPHILGKLRNERYVAGQAAELFANDFSTMDAWPQFQNFWNNLELDRYMNDGGMYRYRRFGRFKWFADGDRLELQPHGPYKQPLYFNPLNGGIERHFAPLTMEIAQNEVFRQILLNLAHSYAELEDVATWKINTYFNRITATTEMKGQPVPEGRHRDGVKFSCLFMANRHGINGGSTTLFDIMHQKPIYNGTLEKPCDTLIFRDDTVFHDTTAITINRTSEQGYRDVLVIEFY